MPLCAADSTGSADTGARPSGGAAGSPGELSAAQRWPWARRQLDEERAGARAGGAVRVRGPLDLPALREAVAACAARHPALRTWFDVEHGEPRRRVAPQVDVPLPVHDLVDGELASGVHALASVPFDLGSPPLLRVHAFRFAPDHHVIAVVAHEMVVDDAGLDILLADLCRAYTTLLSGADPPALPPAGSPTPTGPAPDPAATGYWVARLGGLPPLRLPLDRPRRAGAGDGARLPFTVPADLTAALRSLGRDEGIGVGAVLHGCFAAFLQRVTGAPEIGFATVVPGRDQPDLRRAVGRFDTDLVHRVAADPAEDPRALHRRVAAAAAADRVHHAVAWDEVLAGLGTAPAADRRGLADTRFDLRPAYPVLANPPGVSMRRVAIHPGGTGLDLAVDLRPVGAVLRGHWEYRADLLDEATVAGWARAFLEQLAPHRNGPVPRSAACPGPGLPAGAAGCYPPTPAQRGIWTFERAHPGSSAHILARAVWLSGPLSVPLLRTVCAELLTRHETLRTVFRGAASAEPHSPDALHAVVQAPSDVLTVVEGGGGDDPDADALRLLRRWAASPFDLSSGPLLRALLVRLRGDRSVLGLAVHRIACDEPSLRVLAADLATGYADPRGWASRPPPRRYADFAIGAPGGTAGAVSEADPCGATRVATRGVRAPLAGRLAALARLRATSLTSVLLSAVHMVFGRDGEPERDIALSVAVPARPPRGFDGVVGCFVRPAISPVLASRHATFTEVLSRVDAAAWDVAVPDGRSGPAHRFDVLFDHQVGEPVRLALAAARAVPIPLPEPDPPAHLVLSARGDERGIELRAVCRASALSAAQLHDLLDQTVGLLDRLGRAGR